jgi:hypothetical protein
MGEEHGVGALVARAKSVCPNRSPLFRRTAIKKILTYFDSKARNGAEIFDR